MEDILLRELCEQITLSIVTVTCDDFIGLSKTISSLSELRNSSIELIIVDGSSSPLNFVKSDPQFKNFQEVKILSGPDRGIYDGMNKGLAIARGKFVWFLNGGDSSLLKSIEFLDAYTCTDIPIIFGNYRIGMDRYAINRKAKKMKSIAHGLPTSHQAIFYPTNIFKKIGYDLKFKICADYASIALLYSMGLNFDHISQEIAEFQLDGISGKNRNQLIREANLIQKEILLLNRFQMLVSAIRHNASFIVRRCVYILGRRK